MKSKFLATVLSLAAIAVLATGCSSITSWWNATGQTATIATVERGIGAVITDYMATGKISQAQAIGIGLQSICSVAASVKSVPALSQLIAQTVQQFTADTSPAGQTTAQKIATSVVADIPLIGATAQQITQALIANGTKAAIAANPTPAPTPSTH